MEQTDGQARRYSNFLRIGFNPSEFLLDFAQRYQSSPVTVHTQLVASPVHAKQFAELLRDCVSDYERRYGPIPAGPAN